MLKSVKIKNIKKLESKNDRYDLTIGTNHNFFANNILIHNTSARFGKVWVEEDFHRISPWYKKLLHKFGMLNLTKVGFQLVVGTRNTILGKAENSFYGSQKFRYNVIAGIENKLYEGETLYGEIVGFTDTGKSIMPSHPTEKLKDKELEKKYGKTMHYKYGCIAEDPNKCTKLYIYRITRVDSKGNAVEYSWPQVKARCIELGLDYVPEIMVTLVVTNDNFDAIESLADGASMLDSTHIREGVVLRVEPPMGAPFFLKEKSYNFKVMEGIIKDDDSIVDMEEAS